MSMSTMIESQDSVGSPVLHIIVVGFHHQRGSQVEFAYPKLPSQNCEHGLPKPWSALPHVAIPDGAHNFQDDFIFFHLPNLDENNSAGSETVFGISCYRQIPTKELKIKNDSITRSTIQKSVCVLLKMPLFGFVQSKLALVTEAYFNERDFSRTDVLKELYSNLNHSLTTVKFSDSIFHMGLSLKKVVLHLKHKVLQLLKLILLERKVVFAGYPVHDVCCTILAMVSLLPGTLQKGLARASFSNFKSKDFNLQFPKDQYGLPLEIFGENCIFHPYISLQQMEILKKPELKGFVVGATNILFKHQLHCPWEVLTDLDQATLHVTDPELSKQISLTTEDLRFTDFIIKTLTETKDTELINWEGSDDWIRLQFKAYLLCLLATAVFSESAACTDDTESYSPFNNLFVKAWKCTNNYERWIRTEHPGLESIHQGHPFEGEMTVSDIRLRFQNLVENITTGSEPGKKLGQAVAKTGQIVGGAWSSAKSTLSSWRNWISDIVQDIDEEMETNSQKPEHQSQKRTTATSEELEKGMKIGENDRLGK